MNKYINNNLSKKYMNIKIKKDNTINSLFEIEYFLNNLNCIKKFLNLYKIIKIK